MTRVLICSCILLTFLNAGTASAQERLGEFELVGLRAGTYSVDATSRDLRKSRTAPFLVPEKGQVDVTLTVEVQTMVTGWVLVQGHPVSAATVVLLPTNVPATLRLTTETQRTQRYTEKR